MNLENKVLVFISVPKFGMSYEVFVPVSLKVGEVIQLFAKVLTELTGGYYEYNGLDRFYGKNTGLEYDVDLYIKYTDIRNDAELVFM